MCETELFAKLFFFHLLVLQRINVCMKVWMYFLHTTKRGRGVIGLGGELDCLEVGSWKWYFFENGTFSFVFFQTLNLTKMGVWQNGTFASKIEADDEEINYHLVKRGLYAFTATCASLLLFVNGTENINLLCWDRTGMRATRKRTKWILKC